MPVPQSIIGYDIASRTELGQYHLVIIDIHPLVPVYKGKVEGDIHLRHHLQGIADIKLDFIGVGRTFQPRTGEVFLLIVDFERMEHGTLFQPFGKAQGGISAICPNLKHLPGTYHLHKHLQHPPLQMPRSHAGAQELDMRSPVKRFQIIALRVDMREYVRIQRVGFFHYKYLFRFGNT